MSIGAVRPLSDAAAGDPVLVAATFSGMGRTVVKLIPEALLEAESLAQATVGLAAEGSTPVGRTVQRAVGFPAWPIITDPANARHALNLVGDLEWARRHAANQAKKVKERFDALVGDLTRSAPHFVPTLLEELARIYADAGNDAFARQYFGRAREVERAHDIDVDPVRHEAVFLEFADKGIVGAKDLTREAGDAMARFDDPGEAFEYVLRLNCSRMRSGKEPYANCARDLRKVGKAAGAAPAEVDARLYDEAVGLAAFDAAPGGFWKATRASLVAWLKEHPERADHYLDSIPDELSIEGWLRFLEDIGVWERLIADDGAYLSWTRAMLVRNAFYKLRQFSPRFLAAIEAQGDALADTPVTAEFAWLPIEYVDALTAAGVRWVEPRYRHAFTRMAWGEWAKQERRTRDLRALFDDPALRLHAHDSLPSAFIGENLDELLEHDGGRRLVEMRLIDQAVRANDAGGSLPDHAHRFEFHQRHLTDPRLETLNAGAVTVMRDFDPALTLARALRAGLLAEMTVPAVEESAARLAAGSDNLRPVTVFDSYPQLIVTCGDRFEVIDDGEVTESGQLPVDAYYLEFAATVGDDVVFFHRTASSWTPHVYWHGGTSAKSNGYFGTPYAHMSLPVGGGRLTGAGMIAPGQTDVVGFGAEFACTADGSRIFAKIGGRIREWDADAGEFSGDVVDAAALPEILGIGPLPMQARIRGIEAYRAFPATADSPAGVADGRHYTVTYAVGDQRGATTPLGDFRSARAFDAVISRPGGGVWLVDGMRLIDAADGGLLVRHGGVLDDLPASAIHLLRPRSDEASATMRSFTSEAAAELLAAMSVEQDREVDFEGVADHIATERRPARRRKAKPRSVDAEPGTDAWAIAERLLGTSAPMLVGAVIEVAADVAALDRGFRALASVAEAPENRFAMSTDAHYLLGDLSGARYLARVDKDVPAGLAALAAELAEPGCSKGHGGDGTRGFARHIGHERTLLALLSAPALDRALVREISGLLRKLVADGVLCSGWRTRAEKAPLTIDDGSPHWVDGALYSEVITDNEGRWWLVVEPDDGDVPDATGDPDDRMSAEEFLAGLDAIEAREDDIPDVSAQVETVTAGTNLTGDVARFLVAGASATRGHLWHSVQEPRMEAHREALGMKTAAFNRAHESVEEMPWTVIAAMALAGLPGGDVSRAIAEGPDADAMVEAWRRETGDLGFRLTDPERTAIGRTVRVHADRYIDDILHPLQLDERAPHDVNFYVAPLLTLASLRGAGDPIRPFLREQFRRLAAGIEQSRKEPRFVESVKGELGGDYSALGNQSDLQTHRVLTEGILDELLEDLEADGAREGSGHPMDPLVSAPETVAAVMASLGLDEDSARFFLQILALAVPSDANIREWNGWRKKNIDAAAAPLVDKGLLVEAKRSGAGRTRFLSGGWLEPAPREKGLEVWKAPLYLLWRDAKMRPVVPTCPPLVPMPQLFADAWARYDSGDVPGYEELTTTRYRRR